MSQILQTQETKSLTPIQKVSITLGKFREKLIKALPKNRDVDQEIGSVIATVACSPALQKCTPESIAMAAYDAATLGLPVNKLGLAYLVPYGNEAKLQIGYRGYIQLVIESGFVLDVSAECVYENDHFKYFLGSNPRIEHEPNIKTIKGKFIAVYATARLTSGLLKHVVMSKEQIDHIRSKSRSSSNGPWVTDHDEMAKKSVIKRLCKLLPCNIKAIEVIHRASEIEDNSQFSYHRQYTHSQIAQPEIPRFSSEQELKVETLVKTETKSLTNQLLSELLEIQSYLETIDPKADKLPTNISTFQDSQLRRWIEKKNFAIKEAKQKLGSSSE